MNPITALTISGISMLIAYALLVIAYIVETPKRTYFAFSSLLFFSIGMSGVGSYGNIWR